MFQAFSKSISLYLALQLLVSSIGMPIVKHYCEGNLISSTLFAQENCHQKEEVAIFSCCLAGEHKAHSHDQHEGCASTCDHEPKEKDYGCCSNEYDYVQLDYDGPFLKDSNCWDSNFGLPAFDINPKFLLLSTADQDKETAHLQYIKSPPQRTDFAIFLRHQAILC